VAKAKRKREVGELAVVNCQTASCRECRLSTRAQDTRQAMNLKYLRNRSSPSSENEQKDEEQLSTLVATKKGSQANRLPSFAPGTRSCKENKRFVRRKFRKEIRGKKRRGLQDI